MSDSVSFVPGIFENFIFASEPSPFIALKGSMLANAPNIGFLAAFMLTIGDIPLFSEAYSLNAVKPLPFLQSCSLRESLTLLYFIS